MTTDIATPPNTPTATASGSASLCEESEIYISTATLVFKQPIDYEWHTEVKTPATPVEPEITEPEVQSTAAAAPQESEHVARRESAKSNLFTPATLYNEADDIVVVLDKFMACERYHSTQNWIMNHTLVNYAGSI